jgi:hypothetical protein
VDVPAAADGRSGDAADREQLLDATRQGVTPRDGVEDAARVVPLGLGPGADLGRLVLLQPAIGVRDGDAVEDLDDGLSAGRRRGGRLQ